MSERVTQHLCEAAYLPVTEIMQAVVHTAAPEWPLTSLERFLIDNHLNGLPVVDDNELVGIVSRSDVVRQLCVEHTQAEQLSDYYREQSGFEHDSFRNESWKDIAAAVGARIDGLTVAEVMSRQLLSVSPATRIKAAAGVMVEHHIHRLPVLDGQRLVGLVAALDIVDLVAGCDEP